MKLLLYFIFGASVLMSCKIADNHQVEADLNLIQSLDSWSGFSDVQGKIWTISD
ncbi:hypothetical protein [Pseudobacteriovorax antillogorgiicola]|uniref:Uncharacterized protein n=1 Tax=Pseudobacteriovorax antillogorgiicola TaxID=1513793 RepID=A0A1Y6BZH7_9BACT|nr:hypothetical protein [Pseudobacteriovorax antillogorgiicola]TCS51263.1 hypothetical protein EDD56_111148 [Pseudobacteriovorax antillogorgiicola]SMF36417.1 hypothetical protein SAMN06296036_11130 [Pseudobacteriovorax antillogorgiicola]